MKKIKIMQNPYPMNGEVREVENGKTTINVLKNWYEALAEDEEGNQFIIYWGITDWEAHQEADSENACDWETPYMVLDENGHDIKDYELIWE